MAKKITYFYPNLINSINVSEWTEAYNNYDAKASVNNSAITATDSNERFNRDKKMSQLNLGMSPDLSAWSVKEFTDKIRQAFGINGNDEDVIYTFMADEFFIWKYGFSKLIYNSNRPRFVNKFNNNRSELVKDFHEVFSMAEKSGLKTGEDKYFLINITASKLCGVSLSGVSALLSLIFSDYIGTCDSVFIQQYNFNKGTNYKLTDSDKSFIAEIEDYMANQAAMLNKLSNTEFWTPRKIDKAVWANRR